MEEELHMQESEMILKEVIEGVEDEEEEDMVEVDLVRNVFVVCCSL